MRIGDRGDNYGKNNIEEVQTIETANRNVRILQITAGKRTRQAASETWSNSRLHCQGHTTDNPLLPSHILQITLSGTYK